MGGTFAPFFRASESPIAIACFRLVTFLPLRPLFSVPFFISLISRSTLLPALGLYFLPELFFAAFFVAFFADFLADFFAVDFFAAFLVAMALPPLTNKK